MERVHLQCTAQQTSWEQTLQQHLGYSERCLHSLFPYPLKLSIRYKGKRRLQICKDPSTVLPICTFPGFIGGCSPVKQWHKTKHRETRDPGNRGSTLELGEGQTGWGRGSCAEGCGRGQVQTGVRGWRRAIGRSQDKKTKAATTKTKLKTGMDELPDAFGN